MEIMHINEKEAEILKQATNSLMDIEAKALYINELWKEKRAQLNQLIELALSSRNLDIDKYLIDLKTNLIRLKQDNVSIDTGE